MHTVEKESNVLSTGNAFICLSSLSKLKFNVFFFVRCYSVLSDLHPMANNHLCHMTK